jgi:hypothetical protein
MDLDFGFRIQKKQLRLHNPAPQVPPSVPASTGLLIERHKVFSLHLRHNMSKFGVCMDFLRDHVSPYLLSTWLVCTVLLNRISTDAIRERAPLGVGNVAVIYTFVASFSLWVPSFIAHSIHALHKYGWIALIRRKFRAIYIWVVEHLMYLRQFYWFKVVAAILVAFILSTSVYWCTHNLDILQMLRRTVQIFLDILPALRDPHQLLQAIENWINGFSLRLLVNWLSYAWETTLEAVHDDPAKAFGRIAIGTILLLALCYVGKILSRYDYGRKWRNWWMGNGDAPAPPAEGPDGDDGDDDPAPKDDGEWCVNNARAPRRSARVVARRAE